MGNDSSLGASLNHNIQGQNFSVLLSSLTFQFYIVCRSISDKCRYLNLARSDVRYRRLRFRNYQYECQEMKP